MKGLLCACLLVSLQIDVAHAYEADIHYSATYVLARAVGWPEGDARIIASANQGVDENQDTVAALEMDTTPAASFAGYFTSSLHQAQKNLEFHCFSEIHGQPGRISADVLQVIARHFADVPDRDDDARAHSTRLIALGAALHCQQDAYSHVDFGGSCGAYSGSCYGHTYENFLDQVAFGLLGKHHFNPDHPGVSGHWLLQALEGTARELAAHRPKADARPIPAHALVALSEALRASGLELPDELRRECNRYIAGKWLHDLSRSASSTQHGPGARDTLRPEVASTCRNDTLGSATIVRIPEARFPRLKPDASPALVRADGSYQLLRDGDFDVSRPEIHADGVAGLLPDYNTHKVKVQLSHWSQILALPLLGQLALLSTDTRHGPDNAAR